MEIFGTVRIVLLFICVVLMCVGTGVEQIKRKIGGVTTKGYLYGVKTGSASVKSWKDAGACKDIYQRWQAAYAFAIISCIVVGAALIAVVLAKVLKEQAKLFGMVSAAASVVGFVTTLIAWAIVVGTFHGKFCGQLSFNKQKYDLVGAALIIVTWILLVFDVVLACLGCLKGGEKSA